MNLNIRLGQFLFFWIVFSTMRNSRKNVTVNCFRCKLWENRPLQDLTETMSSRGQMRAPLSLFGGKGEEFRVWMPARLQGGHLWVEGRMCRRSMWERSRMRERVEWGSHLHLCREYLWKILSIPVRATRQVHLVDLSSHWTAYLSHLKG